MPNKNAISLVLLVAIFIAPFAFAFYLLRTDYEPSQSTNKGAFLEQEISLNQLQLKDADMVQHGWHVLTYYDAKDCIAECEKSLQASVNVKKALGKNTDRVQLVLALHDAPEPVVTKLASSYPNILVTNSYTPGQISMDTGLYIVDPFGTLLMTYPLVGKHQGLLSDLKKLLKYSKL